MIISSFFIKLRVGERYLLKEVLPNQGPSCFEDYDSVILVCVGL